MKILAICLIFTGLVMAVCPTPPVFDIPGSPAKCIATMTIEPLKAYGSQVRACEPDGEEYTIVPVQMPIGAVWDANGNSWRWTPTIAQSGNNWFVFKVTDKPIDGLPSQSDTSAYLVTVKRVTNEPPVLLPFAAELE